MILKQENCKDNQGHDQIGRQHMEGVDLPRHRLACDLAADQEIDGIVDRIEEFVEPCLLAHDNPGHVAAHGDAEQEDCEQSKDDLQPTRGSHR